ncbi:MAG: RES domain-containing protein [Dehalococcoidia bacterium]|nr:RES domain-containing protein [Dehalococcoidia bacterium]
MIVFRNTDLDVPFLWESDVQPPARWHAAEEGPAQYFSSTPESAWAEFCRHQEILEPVDLAGIERVLWAVEINDEPPVEPHLPPDTLTGDRSSYPACQAEGRRLRAAGASRLEAPSAAVDSTSSSGWHVEGGLQPSDRRDERTIVVYGRRPGLTGWRACAPGGPGVEVLVRTRHL